jgi:hypothetical protein
LPRVTVQRQEATQKIQAQIAIGEGILGRHFDSEADLDEAEGEYSKWWRYCKDLLRGLFDTDQLSKEFSNTSRSVYLMNPVFSVKVREFQKLVREHVTTLQAINDRLDLYEGPPELGDYKPELATTSVPFPRAESVQPLVVRPRFHRRPAEAAATLGFVLMPFQSDFNDVLSESIRPAVEGNGLVCQRADDIENNDEIMEDVWEGIWKCRIVVADLTDDNPNVFYEVGIADTVGKEVVLIAQNGRLGRPPFDVSARRIVFYDNDVSGRKKLRKDLVSMIAAVLEKSVTR